jgi:hypothetical protein
LKNGKQFGSTRPIKVPLAAVPTAEEQLPIIVAIIIAGVMANPKNKSVPTDVVKKAKQMGQDILDELK